ncbi:hypothetical protein BDZ97DRAFT_1812960 [Flammula alnicola]|nr:hypothetical protein BDZ97DRAFT_1812960 [Flammula alnicola]
MNYWRRRRRKGGFSCGGQFSFTSRILYFVPTYTIFSLCLTIFFRYVYTRLSFPRRIYARVIFVFFWSLVLSSCATAF